MGRMGDWGQVNCIYGCAVGAAVGDAMGMPLEFGPQIPEDRFVRDMIARRLDAGSFTDDTEMSLCLAESLLRCKTLDPNDLAVTFLAWYDAQPMDVGIQTGRMLSWYKDGLTIEEMIDRAQMQMPDAAGNGSIMRCWPLAIKEWDHRDRLVEFSRVQSMVTHPHPDCQAACVFVNAAIVELSLNASPAQAIEIAMRVAGLSPDFLQMLSSAPLRRRSELRNTGWVRHTLESAVWALTNFRTFEEALIQAVNLGGDADTVGIVVGALAGAAYGLSSIPELWKESLHGRYPINGGKTWRSADFIHLADQLIS